MANTIRITICADDISNTPKSFCEYLKEKIKALQSDYICNIADLSDVEDLSFDKKYSIALTDRDVHPSNDKASYDWIVKLLTNSEQNILIKVIRGKERF